MATSEDIIFQFGAKDDVTPILQSIDSNIQNMNSTINKFGKESKDSFGGFEKGAKDATGTFSSFWQSAKSGASDFMTSMQGMNGAIAGILGGIGVTSVWDKIFGTGMKVETNKIIIENLTDTKEAADDLYSVVDKATNNYLMSMQDVIPAMNAFKSSTGANTDELKVAADTMSSFGSQVLLLTGSEQLANTAMYDLSKGLDNSFLTLRRYGVTKESLLATGKWNGEKKDIKGYLEAVEEVAGMDPRMMTTTQGVITSIGKQFSISGKKLSQDFLPVLKTIVTWFYDFDKVMSGNVSKGILLTVGALSSLLAVGYGVSSLWPLLKLGAGAFSGVINLLTGTLFINTGALGTNVAAQTLNSGIKITSVGAAAAHAAALGVEAGATAGATTATWAFNTALLANPITGVIIGVVALAGALIYLKTQTKLLETTQDKANKELSKSKEYIDALNQKQQKSSERIQQLKENLAKLTPGTAEYKKALQELNEEEEKNASYQSDIADATKKEADARKKLEEEKQRELAITKQLIEENIKLKVAAGYITHEQGKDEIKDLSELTFDNVLKEADEQKKINDSLYLQTQQKAYKRKKAENNEPLFLSESLDLKKDIAETDILTGDWITKIGAFLDLVQLLQFKPFSGKYPFGDFEVGWSSNDLNLGNATNASAGMKVLTKDGKVAQSTLDKVNKTTINPKTNSQNIFNLTNNTKDAKKQIDKTDGSSIDIGVTGIDLLKDTYNWGRKLYCIINGCSPGIIPALQRLSSQVKTGDYDIGRRVVLPDVGQLESRLSKMKQAVNQYGVSTSDLKLLNSKVNNVGSKSLTNQYVIKEGAFSIDARNMTQQEAQNLVYLALDGLDNTKNKGVDN